MDSQPTPASVNRPNQLLTYRPFARSTDRLALNIRSDFAGWSPSARAKNKIRKRRPSYFCRVDLCALAAIYCAILALFMCTSFNFHDLSLRGGDLFHARHSRALTQARREDALEVAIERDGRVDFGYQRVVAEDLPKLLADGVQSGSERRVYLRVDQRARYGDVQPVVGAIRDAGITDISFVTENPLAGRLEMANQAP
jgi:biopolymer transport protein ExbD